MLPADDRGDVNSRHDPLNVVPFTEDNESALEAGAAARPESFAARVRAARWSVVAGGCLLLAALFLLLNRMDAAFVAATLGVVAWFWNERNRLRPHGIEADDGLQDEDVESEDRDEE